MVATNGSGVSLYASSKGFLSPFGAITEGGGEGGCLSQIR